jgi:hypothetical protein
MLAAAATGTVQAARPAGVGKLQASSTCLFVCDVQERFRTVIHGFPGVRCGRGATARERRANTRASSAFPVGWTTPTPPCLTTPAPPKPFSCCAR